MLFGASTWLTNWSAYVSRAVLSQNVTPGVLPASIHGVQDLGNIYVSMAQVAKQARELQCPLDIRLVQLTAHGLAHLLGYDHDRPDTTAVMQAKEHALVQAAFNDTAPI